MNVRLDVTISDDGTEAAYMLYNQDTGKSVRLSVLLTMLAAPDPDSAEAAASMLAERFKVTGNSNIMALTDLVRDLVHDAALKHPAEHTLGIDGHVYRTTNTITTSIGLQRNVQRCPCGDTMVC